ncbi:GNAT family N-acetyltransferase [Glaciecola petra]|uniref:GNAT family N-acetyltransferase n=1 Tax=Glaciecola petra TaxID=3075602 RepID=A0ABU2ZX65_9ALTE|nr:GNAT family N-acetyltransferase [Aestuariibacter sp. P117]MDT0596618.1 GNAT family N-acetyltransferase [Aestuariibacter sp. P117]
MQTSVIAENQSFVLRKVTVDDAPFILELTNEKGWLNYIGNRHINNIQDAENYIVEGPLQSYEQYGFGLYLLQRKQTQQALGLCGLLKRPYLDAPDIGFAISQAYYRQGLAYTASSLLLDNLSAITPISQLLARSKVIYASARQSNTASVSLLLKLGFREHSHLVLESDFEDLLLFEKALWSKNSSDESI